MAADGSSQSPRLRAATVETFADPLRTQVYISVYERPGATVAQVARRIDEPAGRVRHQIDRLVEAGLVEVVDGNLEGDARERHHRGVAVPTLDDLGDRGTDQDRRKASLSLMRCVVADIARATRNRTLGIRPGHAEVRVPGEVDERGLAEIEATIIETMRWAEETMIRSAKRLEVAGRSGIEVISAQLFFEAPTWERSAGGRQGPRPSHWVRSTPGPGPRSAPRFEKKPDPPHMSPDLRDALIETLSDQFRAHVLVTIAERPGVTIGQIATRIGESPRRVRHQVERLVEAALVAVDAESPRRNTRERHYRALALPTIDDEFGSGWTDEQRRKIAHSLVRAILADLDGAVRGGTFGTPGQAVVRIPGEVDETGWEELAASMLKTTERIERIMVDSAARLEDAGRPGIEVISALLLFEGPPWQPGEGDRQGPRPTHWYAGRDGRVR
jgi:DNA-binding transcriptional ArsR family regulator